VRAREVSCHRGGGGAVRDGVAGVCFDGCGVRGAGFAGLLGREGFANAFGAVGGFAGRRMGGLGGIGRLAL